MKRLQNAISREEHTQNLGIRGRAFGYQKLLTCMSTIIVGILVLILRLSCQVIFLIYKGFISLELYSLFPHYIPLNTLTPLDYLYKKKSDEILIRNANLWLTVKAIQSNSGITWHFVYTATNARVSNFESLIAYKIYCINNHWQSQKVLLDYNLIKFHKIKS